jgi:hypothetical protein
MQIRTRLKCIANYGAKMHPPVNYPSNCWINAILDVLGEKITGVSNTIEEAAGLLETPLSSLRPGVESPIGNIGNFMTNLCSRTHHQRRIGV